MAHPCWVRQLGAFGPCVQAEQGVVLVQAVSTYVARKDQQVLHWRSGVRKRFEVLIITLYVNCVVIAGDDKDGISFIKGELSKRFEMKDVCEAKMCLGLEITRDRANRILKLSQTAYAESVLERFGMTNCKPVTTPLESRRKSIPDPDPSQKPPGDVPYRSAIGCIMWFSAGARPDIAYAFGCLAQFSESPLIEHWTAIKRVLRYIAGGIKFGKRPDIIPVGFIDSDYARYNLSRKSMPLRWLFVLSAGGPRSRLL